MAQPTTGELITGSTMIYGIIGHPVAHSMSPLMQNREFREAGINAVYVAWDVAPDKLPAAVAGLSALGVRGFNVTIPHKVAIWPLLSDVTARARAVGAVNTVKLEGGILHGDNTDCAGWADDAARLATLEGASVCVVGAGGAARAVAFGAAERGAALVTIVARRSEAADLIANDLRRFDTNISVDSAALGQSRAEHFVTQSDLIVNTTPVGMVGHEGMPIPAEWLRQRHAVYDTIYTPRETELLVAARKVGARTRAGLGMLAGQGAAAFRWWTGHEPDAGRMLATLEQCIELREPRK